MAGNNNAERPGEGIQSSAAGVKPAMSKPAHPFKASATILQNRFRSAQISILK